MTVKPDPGPTPKFDYSPAAPLTDEALRGRMAAIASRVQSTPGTVKAADLIERLARDGAPVTT